MWLGHLPLFCNCAASAAPTVSQQEWQVLGLWLQSGCKSSGGLVYAEKLEHAASVKKFPGPWC